jgi:hypothetical protein
MPTSHRIRRAGKADGAVKIGAAVIGAVSLVVVALLNRSGSDQPAPSQPNVVVNVHNHNEHKGDAARDDGEVARLRARLEAAEGRLHRDEAERAAPDKEGRAKEPAALDEAPRLPPRNEGPPPAPQKGEPKRVVVTVAAKLEPIKLFDSNPLGTTQEIIGVAAGDQTLFLGVNKTYPRAAVRMYLPEGKHRYVIRAEARGQLWVNNQPSMRRLTADGAGELVVKGDSTFDVERAVSREGGYEVRLRPR